MTDARAPLGLGLIVLIFIGTVGAGAGQAPPPLPAPSIMTVAPDQMRLVLLESYRLRPDRRALLAVAEIHRLFTGNERQPVAVAFRDGRFHLTYRNVAAGTLPELPDFPDLVDLLSRWATTLNEQHPLALAPDTTTGGGTPEPFLAADLMTALGKLDAEWRAGRRHAGLLRDATRALTRLALQQMDRTNDADVIEAKALAALALTRALTKIPVGRDEALLASVLGYSVHAERLAASLETSDPLRLYIAGDRDGLKAAAAAPTASVETHYLWLLRLAGFKDLGAWRGWQQERFAKAGFSLPILRAGLEVGTFEANASFGPLLPMQVARELAGSLGKPEPALDDSAAAKLVQLAAELISAALYTADEKIRTLIGRRADTPSGVVVAISRFFVDLAARWSSDGTTSLIRPIETELAQLASRPAGPFLDADALGAYYRGALYSGLAVVGLHQLDSRSSVRDVTALARRLSTAVTEDGAAFAKWYQHLATFKAGEADVRLLLEDFAGGRHLGGRLLLRTFDEFKERASYGDPLLPTGARALIASLDTRATHRFYLADVAHSALVDIRLAEQLYGSVLAIAAPDEPGLKTWYAALVSDTATLRAQARSPMLRPDQRAEALVLLEKEGLTDAAATAAEFRRLLEEFPDDWKSRSKYVDYLEGARRYAEARAVIQGWVDTHDAARGFDYIFARTALARMHGHEGQYAQGLAAVAPVVQSGQAGAMERSALLLQRLGRGQEAERLARQVIAAYPDSIRSRAVLAEILWRQGADGRAVEAFSSGPFRISSSDWLFTVAPRFVDVFGEGPEDRALAAFGALLRGPFNHMDLQRLAFPLAKAGKHELAFAMVSQLRFPGLGQAEFWIDAYRYLKEAKGKQAAQEWLRSQVPPQMLDPISMIIYGNKQYELLWDLYDVSQPRRGDDFVWLMRAAAALRQSPDARQQAALRERYATPGGSHYHAAGRFLMGLISERELLESASDPKRRCELSYYVGVRAQSEGRYAEASDWYRVSVETGLVNNGEYRWAHSTLTKWRDERKSLARLAAAKL